MSNLLIHPEVFRNRIEDFGFQFLSLEARQLEPAKSYDGETGAKELAIVVLGGICSVKSTRGEWRHIGGRANVFDGMPYTLYLPVNTSFTVKADTDCDLAFCYSRAEEEHPAHLVTPDEVGIEIRGGGNATRQINSMLPPSFPAHRLIVVEVFTPSGSWSSFPPHKHDVHNPPGEVDLEEIYYYRIDRPEGFAVQKVYTADGRIDETLTVRDGELVLIPEGYHPVVAAHGYNVYYLNALAGSARSLAASDDPNYAWVRGTWQEKDPPAAHGEKVTEMKTRRMTMAQALIQFLKNQYVERDGRQNAFFAGMLGIFGHGNVAGIGQALQQNPDFKYILVRNEQSGVHMAAGFAKASNRMRTFACTSSIGPGATNMITGAALATINRLPVLLLPGDIFARRNVAPVLQQLESTGTQDIGVNDCFKPVSRYWDRIYRPEQLITALPEVMRVLTSPSDCGAVTLALPQDVQTEAYDYPEELFRKRVWLIRRGQPDTESLARAIAAIRSSSKPLIVAGGGVLMSEASQALDNFVRQTGIPVAETQAGKGSLAWDHPQEVGAIGATGTLAANRLAHSADLVIGIGTRYADFTSASMTAFQNPGVRFVNINTAEFDAYKVGAIPVVADARVALEQLAAALPDKKVSNEYAAEISKLKIEWESEVDRLFHLNNAGKPAQSEVIGAMWEASGPRDVLLSAAGSHPGDLHKLWRTRTPNGYHMEYGYSCMGYEIPAALGAKIADPSREIYVFLGDGTYLMMPTEIVTSVQEGVKIIIVLVDNHGFGSIGNLSRSLGQEGFGTSYRLRSKTSGQLDGDRLDVDFAANARSLGAHALKAGNLAELKKALDVAKSVDRTTVIVVETDPSKGMPGYESWWDVSVAEVSEMDSVRKARASYEEARKRERHHL